MLPDSVSCAVEKKNNMQYIGDKINPILSNHYSNAWISRNSFSIIKKSLLVNQLGMDVALGKAKEQNSGNTHNILQNGICQLLHFMD